MEPWADEFTGWARHFSRRGCSRSRGRWSSGAGRTRPRSRTPPTSSTGSRTGSPSSRRPPQPTSRPSLAAGARRGRPPLPPHREAGRPDRPALVPRLGISYVLVEGTDAASLRLGPARDDRSFMPGEGNLVYVAGHRTTFAAPFSHIDEFRARRPGPVHGALRDVHVRRHRAYHRRRERPVGAPAAHHELLALQACHPRFFATQRYIVWARLRCGDARGTVVHRAGRGLGRSGRG